MPLVCLLLAIASSRPVSATSVFYCRNELAFATKVSLELSLGGLVGLEAESELDLFDDSERWRDFSATIFARWAEKLAGVGLELVPPEFEWQRGGAFQGPARPFYSLVIDLRGQTLPEQPEIGAFLIVFATEASFMAPEYESVTTFEQQRVSLGKGKEIEARITLLLDEMLDALLATLPCDFPKKRTFEVRDGISIDLTDAGFDDLLGFFRHELADQGTRVDLYFGQRSAGKGPAFSFTTPFPFGEAPSFFISSDRRHLIIARWGLLEFRSLLDGALERHVGKDDLLAAEDQRISKWENADFEPVGFDAQRDAVLVAISTCRLFEEGCERGERRVELAVDAKSGDLLGEKRNHFPDWQGLVSWASSRAQVSEGQKCPQAPFSPLMDLVNRSALALPTYTEIAQKARIMGTVIVDILIDANGEVSCLDLVKGLPMGLSEATLEKIKSWRFSATGEGRRTRAELDFRIELVHPDHD